MRVSRNGIYYLGNDGDLRGLFVQEYIVSLFVLYKHQI